MKSLLFAIVLLVTACNPQPAPAPSPSPSPAASAVPSPSPSPSPSPVPTASPTPSPVAAVASFSSSADVSGPYGASVQASMASGETRGFWLKLAADGCQPVVSSGTVAYALFRADPMTAATPSYVGALQTFYDRLVPVASPCTAGQYFVDVTGFGTLSVGGATLTATDNGFAMPAKPSVPLYIGLDPSFTRVLGMDSNVSTQGPITLSTVRLLRAHRIEPFKQNILSYPRVDAQGNLQLDTWSEFQGSFRQLVMDGAIAPPCLVPPVGTPSAAYLAAVQRGLQGGTFPAGSWAYGWDEDQLADPAPALARVNLIKQGAPSLIVWATREPDSKFSSVDLFVPILDWFKQPGHVQTYAAPFGLYTSCMAQGSCGTGPRPPSGAPLLVADAPAVHALMFPLVSAALGAKVSLYYSAVEHFGTALNYFAAGNGDGQLLYAGQKAVYPSVRMKLLREGMFTAEYYRKKPTAFAGLVRSGTDFSKDYAAIQAARDGAASH